MTKQGGRTALHLAAEQGNQSIVSMLLEAGATGSLKDKNGDTPFTMATDHCKELLSASGYSGDMHSTNEARDLAMIAELDRSDKINSKADLERGPRAAMRDKGRARSGVVTVRLEKSGETYIVNVISGDKLTDHDAVGGNDVYVVVEINSTDVQRTKTIPDAGPNPVWNQGRGQELTFTGIKTLQYVVIRVYDEDFGAISSDELIGFISLPVGKINDLNSQGSQWEWEADLTLREDEDEAKIPVPATSEKYKVDGIDPNATVPADGVMGALGVNLPM